jgi:hypothetical protein
MALPNKVVEQLGRAPVRTPGWSGRVLMFSGTFLIISVTTFLGIRFGLQPYTTSQVKNLDTRVAEFARQVPVEQQLEIAALYSQVINLRSILNNQVSQIDLFEWLQKNTNVNVQLSSINFNKKTRTLDIGGTAKTLDNLGEQINIFLAQKNFVNSAVLSSINPPESKNGPWDFQLSIVLNSQFYSRAADPVVVSEVPVETEEDSSEIKPEESSSTAEESI